MAKGSKLSEKEKGKIDAYRDVGKSNREIGHLLGRSPTVVDNYGKKKIRGITKKLSDRDTRRICREASNSTKRCSQINCDLNLNVSPETFRRTILKNPNLVSRKIKRAQALTLNHKRIRLEFGRRNFRKDCSKAEYVNLFLKKAVLRLKN